MFWLYLLKRIVNFQKDMNELMRPDIMYLPYSYLCTLHHLIGLEVRMNRSTVKFVSFFVNSQDNMVKIPKTMQ